MSDSSSWSFSLSREDILRRKAERDQIAEQITSLQQKLDAEDRWFEALSLILPPAYKATVFSPQPPADGNETRSLWRRSIEPVIGAATRGLLPKEVAQGIREGDDEVAKERLARNPNGLYAALERMAEDGQIIRYRDKIYSAALYGALTNNGELEDDSDDSGLSGVNLFIVTGINIHGPMAPKQIMEMMREDNTLADRLANNPQYGYSAIARLARQGHIQKGSDGRYRLPSEENEMFRAPAQNDSDVGSVFS